MTAKQAADNRTIRVQAPPVVRACPPRPAPRGYTLIELVLVMSLLAIGAATIVSAGTRLRDALAVHGAAREVASLLAMARDRAAAVGMRTAVRVDAAQGAILVHCGADTLARLAVQAQYAVQLSVTRDSLAYQPSGLAYGAANSRITLSRGASHDTITVSRLGRVRW
ncbi:MAG: GspH/FimT family protein [Gemmatimonadaceae bacterium]